MPTHAWVKGRDPFDNSPRYSIEGRDPSSTLERVAVVIYQVRESEYRCGPKRRVYYASVLDTQAEHEYRYGPFRYLKDAKREAEAQFDELLEGVS